MSLGESIDPVSEAFVWTDQDLCTGCGCCGELAPSVFKLAISGVSIVHLDGAESHYRGIGGRVVSVDEVAAATNAAEKCPGEIIYIEKA